MSERDGERRRLWRSRWAAVGAAVAITLGAGTLLTANAATPSIFVPVTPTRVLDTRTNTGLTGPIPNSTPRTLQITGPVPTTTGTTTIVPTGATAIVANLTAVTPTSRGFVAIRPGNATGTPTTSNINITTPGTNIPNAITVQLAPNGTINLFYKAADTTGTTHLLLDIVGYYQTGPTGPAGPTGPQGPQGATGPAGATGTDGDDSVEFGPQVTTRFPTSGPDGWYNDITIGVDGNPVISTFDVVDTNLDVVICRDPQCTTSTRRTLATGGDTGSYTSVAIGSTGDPIISFYDDTNGDLEVAACNDPSCTTAAFTTLDGDGSGPGDVGRNTSIAIGSDGNPVITYRDNSADQLKMAVCVDPTCSDADLVVLDPGPALADYSSVAIGQDGNPVVSYVAQSLGRLVVVACSDPACASRTSTVYDLQVGPDTSIAIGADGDPVVVYYDNVNGHVKLAACSNPTCTSAVLRTIDPSVTANSGSVVTVGVDGRPLIVYRDGINGVLRLAACDDPTCATSRSSVLESDPPTGEFAAVTLGANGNPIIAFVDHNSDLAVHACGNPRCNPFVRTGR